jgi:hypothetical protein
VRDAIEMSAREAGVVGAAVELLSVAENAGGFWR